MAIPSPRLTSPSSLTVAQPYRPEPIRQPRRGPAIVGASEFTSLPALYACAKLITNAIASLPIHYLTGDRIDTRSKLSGFFYRPTAHDTWYTYLDGLVLNLLIHGNAFVPITELNRDGTVRHVEVIRPTHIVPKWNETETFATEYYLNGLGYESKDLMHIREQSEGGYAWGISRLKALSSMLSTHISEQTYVRNTYEDGARVAGFLSGPADLHADVLGRTAEAMAQNIGGRGSGIMALPGSYEWHQVALNNDDLELLSARRWSAAEAAMVMGVPQHLIGAVVEGSSNTYSNVRQDMQLFEALTLSRYRNIILDAHAQFDIRFEFGELDLAKPPIGERYSAYQTGIDAGLISVEEAREREGLLGDAPERPAAQTKSLTFQAAQPEATG